jgi:hypothetical protein
VAVTLLLAAATLRLAASVAGGLLALANHDGVVAGRTRAAEVLNTFGAGGDTAGALLAVAAAAGVWWLHRRPAESTSGAARPWALAVLGGTALLVVLHAVGVVLLDIDAAHTAPQLTILLGFAATDLLLCLAGTVVVRHVPAAAAEAGPGDPLLFAVDRETGEVFAFFSFAELARAISVYSVEDGEFAFYDDDGRVFHADVVDDAIRLTPTEVVRRDELLARLRGFADKHGLPVVDRNEPLSYLRPVSDWQWLELWPGWLRWIGRIVRRLQVPPVG